MADDENEIEVDPYELQYEGKDEKLSFVTKDGAASATFPNKDRFVGNYKRKSRNGKGVYTFAEEGKLKGAKYEGEYVDGKRHGLGTFTYPDHSKYIGQWKDGMRHGHGLYTYKNGDKYVGSWEFDQRAGNGTYVYSADQTQVFGRWVEGRCDDGVYSFYDAKLFSAQFSNNAITKYLD